VNLAYSGRLLCLCLATFFLVNLTAGLAVAALATTACRFSLRLPARSGAHFLLALRLVPMTLGLLVVGGLCVPSYLWMEPDAASEPVGWVCLIVAAFAALAWFQSASRTIRAFVRSSRYLRQSPARKQNLRVSGELYSLIVMEGSEPLFALAGILRPHLVVSQRVLSAFPDDELASALRHEQAHAESYDNLKRLLVLLAPDALPFLHNLRSLERAWARLAEWAADDAASTGTPRRSLALASALVRAARVNAVPASPPALVTALLANGKDLAVRVDRLLGSTVAPTRLRLSYTGLGGAILFCAVTATAMLHPSTLTLTHAILERLIH
jgi:Zn-dependent protease with chaperone function